MQKNIRGKNKAQYLIFFGQTNRQRDLGLIHFRTVYLEILVSYFVYNLIQGNVFLHVFFFNLFICFYLCQLH